MKVVKRKKRERKNPEAAEAIEVDAFAEDGMVVVQFGESEIALDPEQAEGLAELIQSASEDATEEVDEGDEDEDEDED